MVCPTGHFGNWEFQGVVSPLLVGPFAVVARPLDNPALDRRLVGLRTSTGNTVIYKKRALSQIMQTIRGGGVVAIVIDQNVQKKDGIFVDFFGRPACTTTVAAALALKLGCMIVPVRCLLMPDGRYRMVYGPPVEWKGRAAAPRRGRPHPAPHVDHRGLGARAPRAVALAPPAVEDPSPTPPPRDPRRRPGAAEAA